MNLKKGFNLSFWEIGTLVLLVIMSIMYFIVIPYLKNSNLKNKVQAFEKMQNSLKIGDKIILNDGVTGVIKDIIDDECIILSNNSEILVKKVGIVAVEK